MTSLFNFALAISVAILAASVAVLGYILVSHPQLSTTTTTSSVSSPPTTSSTIILGSTTTPLEETRIIAAELYVATPEVMKCAAPINRYVYFFNITLYRAKQEDPVMPNQFKALTRNGTQLGLRNPAWLPQFSKAEQGSLSAVCEGCFPPWPSQIPATGRVVAGLEFESDSAVDITSIVYGSKQRQLDKTAEIYCVRVAVGGVRRLELLALPGAQVKIAGLQDGAYNVTIAGRTSRETVRNGTLYIRIPTGGPIVNITLARIG